MTPPPPTYSIGGMEDYPKSLLEMQDRFSTEEACRDYLFKLRWPDGLVCPCCGSTAGAWPAKRHLYICSTCRFQISVTSGTIFHSTRKPLRLWLHAIWNITSQKYGANALGLQRVLELGSYQTAWEWMHRLRRAMVRPGRDKLSGLVEVDETFIGGKRTGKRGRRAGNKTLVVIAVEDKGKKGFGRIRIRRTIDASGATLNKFIKENIETNSTIRTDGWSGYNYVLAMAINT